MGSEEEFCSMFTGALVGRKYSGTNVWPGWIAVSRIYIELAMS
jgi:hypothetical protein